MSGLLFAIGWAFLLCAMVVDKQVNSGQEVRIDDCRCRSSLDVVITIQHPAHVHFFRNIIKG